jgi:uncharacterized membrane protein YphA (DoxX/SURF4 family)
MIDPLFPRVSSAALGALLIAAAWHKFTLGTRLRSVVADYRVLPAILAPAAARIVPIAELTLGLVLLSGLGSPAAAPAAAALFGIYGLAISFNLLRGRAHIDCGCGLGAVSGSLRPLSWWLVLRNAALAGLALLPLAETTPRALGLTDGFTLIAALLALGLLYLAAQQLTVNGAAIRGWRQPRD